MSEHKIIYGDCLKVSQSIETNSIDLIILDPPYNIGKDKVWDVIPNYIDWMGNVFLECQRLLKGNGSFYFFHNDFLQMIKLQQRICDNIEFVFKQLLVWDKWYNPIKKGNNLQGAFFKIVNNPDLRNYPKMAEYILYYTFQDETGLKTIVKDTTLYKGLREYCLMLREYIGYTKEKMLHTLGSMCSQHFLEPYSPQWQLCTEETYQKLIVEFSIDKWIKFRTYKSLNIEYNQMILLYCAFQFLI
jgi:site-specific DNA-methyltransferase (adenine-specific)